MRTIVLLLVAAILPGSVRAQDKIRIQEVGLQGYYSTSVPTPARVHIPALAQSQTIDLVFTIDSSYGGGFPSWRQTDRFEKQIPVISGKPLDVDLPILLPAFGKCHLHLVGSDSQGQKFGGDDLDLKSRKPGAPIAVYCRDDSQCFEAQKQIATMLTSAKVTSPRGDLSFVFLKELRNNWLVYRAAEAVVIAGSIADMSPDQGKALEYYLRSGGTLVLVEKEAANTNFLSVYPASPDRVRIGGGDLYRLPSLESKVLTNLFSAIAPVGGAGTSLQERANLSDIERLVERTGVSFTFPRLRWLLIWIGIYILFLGPINFVVLNRRRKLEWGWITMSATALLFAAGLYISSSSHRPKNFALDSATIYWMDEHSPVALEHRGFRIYSPDRTEVGLIVDDDVLVADGTGVGQRDDSGALLGSDITGNGRNWLGWQVRLAPPLEIETPMRRWSFRDFYAEGFHEFPGTVHWTSATRLKNDTGLKFGEALYVDSTANAAYPIHGMSPHQEVDLDSIVPKTMRGGSNAAVLQLLNGRMQGGESVHRPFTLGESQLLRVASGEGTRIFAGEIEPVLTDARLENKDTTQHSLTVAVVVLDQP